MPPCTPIPSASILPATRSGWRAFGGMPHFCLGAHLARAELCTSLELLLARLPGLRLREGPMPARFAVLRGVHRLPVEFDDVLPA